MTDEPRALVAFREQPAPELAPIAVTDLLADAMAAQAERTRKAYGRDLQAFARFVGIEQVDAALRKFVGSPSAVANGVALAFQAEMTRRGLARATINRRIAALRSVVKLAAGAGITDVRLELVKTLKVEEKTRDVRGPGLAVVRRLVAVADADGSAAGARDAAMLRWLYLLGLRRNEVRLLLLGDCELRGEVPTIWVEQKGKEKKQPIRVQAQLRRTLVRWLAVRTSAAGALFCSLDRRSAGAFRTIDPSGINRIVRRRAEEAGYAEGRLEDGRAITPHAIRHTAITRVAAEKGLIVAQAFARHENPATTKRYLDEMDAMSMDAQAFMIGTL